MSVRYCLLHCPVVNVLFFSSLYVFQSVKCETIFSIEKKKTRHQIFAPGNISNWSENVWD